MLELLQDIAVDVTEPVTPENPLRQVIVNTHSPVVVNEIPDDSLLVAETVRGVRDGGRFPKLQLSCLPGTWRAQDNGCAVTSRGSLLAYLSPNIRLGEREHDERSSGHRPRVMDRPDMQGLSSSMKPE
jgi:hypothetical protein